MSSNATSYYSARKDALRLKEDTFNDLGQLVVTTFDLYKKIHQLVAPYNTRQQGNLFYIPPSREFFREHIRSSNNLVESEILNRMIGATVDFYTKHKGKLQLVEPHPSVLHSVQFQAQNFKLTEVENFASLVPKLNKSFDKTLVRNLVKLEIFDHGNVAPIYFENFKIDKFQYLILRPKMGKTGVPVVKFWEALFFKQPHRYLINHTDAEINPRYVGII